LEVVNFQHHPAVRGLQKLPIGSAHSRASNIRNVKNMNKPTKTLIGASMLMLAVLAVSGSASATNRDGSGVNVTNCDHAGNPATDSWGTSCRGVDGGCVGSWKSTGHYDENGNEKTDYSSSSMTCLVA
jgi:hypothetical protein